MAKQAVAFFKNSCIRCLSVDAIPLLGDCSYGAFIFQTVEGKDFVVVNFLDNDVVAEVERLAGKAIGLYPFMA